MCCAAEGLLHGLLHGQTIVKKGANDHFVTQVSHTLPKADVDPVEIGVERVVSCMCILSWGFRSFIFLTFLHFDPQFGAMEKRLWCPYGQNMTCDLHH